MRQLKITKQITRRESAALERYLLEISSIPLITPEKEVELGKRIQKGDQAALDQLVCANLRFVVSVAKKYQNNNVPLNDLINIGNKGLMKAARRFDGTRGFKFISYAVWWVRQPMLQEIAERARVVRMPLNRMADYNQITRAEVELQQEKGRKVSMEEIAEHVGLDLREVQNIMQLATKHMSIDNPFMDGESSTLADVLPSDAESPPDQKLHDEALTDQINHVLNNVLSPRDANIVRMYHGFGGHPKMTFEEIGAELTPSITRERVRQLVDKSMKLLRTDAVRNELRIFI